MNEYQLEALATKDLMLLYRAVKSVLRKRRPERKVIRNLERPTKTWDRKLTTIAKHNERNASDFYAVPRRGKVIAQQLSHFLHPLIQQDWSSLYPCSGGDAKFYVYCHIDPSRAAFVSAQTVGGNYGGEPFYVGKGCGDRAWDLKRNQGHGKRIKAVLSDGFKPEDIVKVVFDGLTEAKAFELEAKLIYFFGSIYEPGSKARKRATLLNLDLPAVPKFIGHMTPTGGPCDDEGIDKADEAF